MTTFKCNIYLVLVIVVIMRYMHDCEAREHRHRNVNFVNPTDLHNNYKNDNNVHNTYHKHNRYHATRNDESGTWLNLPHPQFHQLQQSTPYRAHLKRLRIQRQNLLLQQKQAHLMYLHQFYLSQIQNNSAQTNSHIPDNNYSLASHHIYDDYAILPSNLPESNFDIFNGSQATAHSPITESSYSNNVRLSSNNGGLEENEPHQVNGPPIEQYPTIPRKLKAQLTKENFVNEGGDGEIFKVKVHGKTKALKRVKRIKKDFTLERTKFEIDLMSALQSKYVIKINNKYKDHKFIYYTMDLATYGDGFEMINKMREYYGSDYANIEFVVRFAIFDIVRGLMAIHALGVLHHDLKWTNTLVFRSRFAIADFGMSRPMNLKEEPGNIFGTLNTLAPEALNAEQPVYDKRADIWSLGVMLYEALFGFNPFNKTGNLPSDTVIENIRNLKTVEVPNYVNENAKHFLQKTICTLENRIPNIHEVFHHSWFDEIRHFFVKRHFSPWVDIFTKKPIEENRKTLKNLRKMLSQKPTT